MSQGLPEAVKGFGLIHEPAWKEAGGASILDLEGSTYFRAGNSLLACKSTRSSVSAAEPNLYHKFHSLNPAPDKPPKGSRRNMVYTQGLQTSYVATIQGCNMGLNKNYLGLHRVKV